jgi:hypothetical protein
MRKVIKSLSELDDKSLDYLTALVDVNNVIGDRMAKEWSPEHILAAIEAMAHYASGLIDGMLEDMKKKAYYDDQEEEL